MDCEMKLYIYKCCNEDVSIRHLFETSLFLYIYIYIYMHEAGVDIWYL